MLLILKELPPFASFSKRRENLNTIELNIGFNEVAKGDLGGEICKVSEPLNSC